MDHLRLRGLDHPRGLGEECPPASRADPAGSDDLRPPLLVQRAELSLISARPRGSASALACSRQVTSRTNRERIAIPPPLSASPRRERAAPRDDFPCARGIREHEENAKYLRRRLPPIARA